MLPDEVHRLVKNESMGFSGTCGFLLLKSDGSWNNIFIANAAGDEETKSQCPTNRQTIDKFVAVLPPSNIHWSKHQFQDGIFYTRDITKTEPSAIAGHMWKVDYIVEDFPSAKLI